MMIPTAKRVYRSGMTLAFAVMVILVGPQAVSANCSLPAAVAMPPEREVSRQLGSTEDQTKQKKSGKKKGEDEEGKKQAKAEAANKLPAVLWRDPGDVSARDLLNGEGGAADAPAPNADYVFVKEDMNGTSPKFYVRDPNGVEWLVKIGIEAKPETAATRIVWAMGYFTDEDYFLPQIHVTGMQKLHRRAKGVSLKTGIVLNVRLKRQGTNLKSVENWDWQDNPFREAAEFRRLLVVMAVINNWDLKEVNNKVYVTDDERHFVVSDLGAAFGKTGWPIVVPKFLLMPQATKGVLKDYENSKLISRVQDGSVTFVMKIGTPFFVKVTRHKLFSEYARNAKLEKSIPIDDARWVGKEMAQLRPEQIRDAFRAAGYGPQEVEGFARTLEQRVAKLNHLDN